MRVLCALILLLVIAALGIFAWQNTQTITLHYLNQSMTVALPLMIAIVYGLGMVSGGAFLSFLRRTFMRATERSPQR